MAKLELSEETKAGIEEVREADLLIAVAVPVEADQLRAAATQAVLGTGEPALTALRTVVAFPGLSGAEAAPQAKTDLEPDGNGQRIALRALFAARRQSLENSLASRCQHLSGALCHGAGAGG